MIQSEESPTSSGKLTFSTKTVFTVGVLAAIAVILGLLIGLVPQFFHALTRVGYSLLPVILVAVIVVAASFFVAWLRRKKGDEEPYRGDSAFAKNFYFTAPHFVVSLVLLVLALVAAVIVYSYVQPRAVYNASDVQTQSADDLSFDTRAPYDVASAVSSRSLGDTTGDSTGAVKSNPSDGTYSVSVKRRGIGKGYESVQSLAVPQFGSPTSDSVEFCEYDESASLRLGGLLPSNSLNAALARRTALNVGWDSGDAIAVCKDKNTPMLYVPLTKSVGFPGVHQVPAGVAIYNGKTGELTIEKDLKKVDAGVPIYPQSLAAQQRESLKTADGFKDWFFRRAGFDDTDKGDDPNGSNRTEFAMKREDGAVDYVTPLTPRGSSSSIVGLATVDSTSVTNGKLNPIVVNRYESSRKATSTVAADIIGDTLSGYKASGLKVFEVTPGPDGTWVASIGRDQSILYRASIEADGSITLIDGDDGKGAGDGEELESLTTKPLEDMSPSELQKLGDDVLKELSKRAEG